MTGLRDIPTRTLLEMWDAERERLSHLSGLKASDYDALFELRRELDRRIGEPKPTVDVNYAKEYLTD